MHINEVEKWFSVQMLNKEIIANGKLWAIYSDLT